MSLPPDADVAVVGCGPAGSIAAQQLAAAGLHAVLLDAAELPRYKTCGGGVVRRAAALLSLPELGPVVERTCHAAELRASESAVHCRVERAWPLVYMTMRDRLDFALARAAERAGATLVHPCAVRDLREVDGGIEIRTSRGTLRASWVVGADGANGVVARRSGWTRPLATLPALEWEIEVAEETLLRFLPAARFDIGEPARGYAWVFPKSDRLSVGLLTRERPPGRLKDALQHYLRRLGLGEPRRIEQHGFVIPRRPRATVCRGRVLLVGDAAGLADPITSEGISHAAASGRIAARALIDGALDPSRVRRLYRRALEAEVLSELRIARVLAHLVYDHPRLRRHALSRMARTIAEVMTEVIAGRRTYRQLLLNPLNYAKLLRAAGLQAIAARRRKAGFT
jgi:geranylgeranyl reductase family protein